MLPGSVEIICLLGIHDFTNDINICLASFVFLPHTPYLEYRWVSVYDGQVEVVYSLSDQ